MKPGVYDDFELGSNGHVAALGFLADGVTLASEAGPELTVLDLSAGDGLAPQVMGLYVLDVKGSETRVIGFKFSGAPVSGALAIAAVSSENVVISDCIFKLDDPASGTDESRGGVYFSSSGRIEDCRFEGCRGPSGAGLFLDSPGWTIDVERCVFQNCKNQAILGGGLQMTIVRDCLFESNVSLNSSSGGIEGRGPGIVENCVFRENEGGLGGALSGGGLEVRGCLFDSNRTTGSGAALRLGAGGTNIAENNTIVRSVGSTFPGSAIVLLHDPAILRNNIIAYSSGSPAIRVISTDDVTSVCNVFWENVDGIGVSYVRGFTDRQVDPLFCDPEAANWKLSQGSPGSGEADHRSAPRGVVQRE